MPLLPKSLMTVGANFLTVRARRRLEGPDQSEAEQARVFAALIAKLSASSYWAKSGVEPGMTYDHFQRKVHLSTYETLATAVDRMKRGEPDVLWPGQCSLYAVSSGTTAGRTKYIPVTDEMVEHFKDTGLDSLLAYSARAGGASIFKGKLLFLGGSTSLAPIEDSLPFEAYAGDLSGIGARNLPSWVESHLYEPGQEIAQLADWPKKIDAIAEHTFSKDISLIAGIPSWVLILAERVKQLAADRGRKISHHQELWPHLQCLVHGGVPIGPFQDELRAALGPTVKFHEVYPASEGFVAVQDATPAEGLRVLTDAKVFYEFLPMSVYDESNLTHLGSRAVPLSAVKPNEDYALIMTTAAGLCRYVIGDVVRFVSTTPPRLTYVGRSKLQLSAFGEHVIEKEITDSLTAVCKRSGWTIVNFHVAPLFVNSATGHVRGRHEWWIELKPGTQLTPTGTHIAPELDIELQRLNDDYEAKRKGGGLDAPLVRLVMPGIFEHWFKSQGKWGGQNKMPRCRSDRLVADQLAKIANFAEDQL